MTWANAMVIVFLVSLSALFWGWIAYLLFGRRPPVRPAPVSSPAPAPPLPAPVTVNVTVNTGGPGGGTTTTVVPPPVTPPAPVTLPRPSGPTPRSAPSPVPAPAPPAAATVAVRPWGERHLALPGEVVEFIVAAADRTAATPLQVLLEVESQRRGETEFRLTPCGGTVVKDVNVRNHLLSCLTCRAAYGLN